MVMHKDGHEDDYDEWWIEEDDIPGGPWLWLLGFIIFLLLVNALIEWLAPGGL